MSAAIDSDRLLEEIEESMPQGQPNTTRFVADALDDLDQLLEESLEGSREREQYQADLKARKRGFTGMSADEVAFCNSRMAAFEQARVWRPVENLAVFTRFKCLCGQDKLVFTRWMQAQQSRTNATSRRWDTVMAQLPGIPTRCAEELRAVDICPVCAVASRGLDLHNMVKLQEVLK